MLLKILIKDNATTPLFQLIILRLWFCQVSIKFVDTYFDSKVNSKTRITFRSSTIGDTLDFNEIRFSDLDEFCVVLDLRLVEALHDR